MNQSRKMAETSERPGICLEDGEEVDEVLAARQQHAVRAACDFAQPKERQEDKVRTKKNNRSANCGGARGSNRIESRRTHDADGAADDVRGDGCTGARKEQRA